MVDLMYVMNFDSPYTLAIKLAQGVRGTSTNLNKYHNIHIN